MAEITVEITSGEIIVVQMARGYSGYSGRSGFSGYSGANPGASGYSGYSGKSGFSGISGKSGYSGAGTSGFSGYSGRSAYSGYSGAGATGVSGFSGYSGAGSSGFSGYSGAGASGFSGYSGTSGYSGYSGPNTIPQNSQSADYTLVLADAGKQIFHPAADTNNRTFTIPANGTVGFAIGTTITFVNQVNTITIAITTDTLTLYPAGTTGSRTLAANNVATALKVASAAWIITGTSGLT